MALLKIYTKEVFNSQVDMDRSDNDITLMITYLTPVRLWSTLETCEVGSQ